MNRRPILLSEATLAHFQVPRPRAAAVYHLFDDAGELLYIGSTGNVRERVRSHRREHTWGESITYGRWDWYAERWLAYRFERRAILRDKPPHNIRRPMEWPKVPSWAAPIANEANQTTAPIQDDSSHRRKTTSGCRQLPIPQTFDGDLGTSIVRFDHPGDGAVGVYWIYAKDGRLLYVGKSTDLHARLTQHARRAPWREPDMRFTWEWHPFGDDAAYFESVAIFEEEPVNNKVRPKRQPRELQAA